MFKKITSCRSCSNKKFTDILTLGNIAISDFIDNPLEQKGIKAPLELILCDSHVGGCGLLQLRHSVSGETLYRNYWYRSGINKTMMDELADIAQDATKMAKLKLGDFVIDIGANDGTLLRKYNVQGLNTVGFEPAKNLHSFNKEGTTKIITDFFNYKDWNKEFGNAKAKVITAIGMFYDLDDPNSFLIDVCKCLAEDGTFIIQMMYMPFAIKRNAFDGICHEHLEYYTLLSLENLLSRHGLEIFDVKIREDINEGSVRFYIRKVSYSKLLEGGEILNTLRNFELNLELENLKTYEELVNRINISREATLDFIKKEKKKGKKIHGYAASTKGNTTLQYYGITSRLLDAIADRNPAKWGKYTVGSEIPIISEEQSRNERPDYYFILAWHFLDEFIEREKEFLRAGGKFIVSMPEFRIIGD
jgi:NDP-4-keto-2,6-dideoxyhexose 3-C-methyltransferase